MNRRAIAIAAIAILSAGAVFLYRSERSRIPEQGFSRAGERVVPATYYYILLQNGKQVGAASSAIDTTTARVTATDLVRAEVPVGDDTLRIEARSEARYTRELRLRDFVIRAAGDLAPFEASGEVDRADEKKLSITMRIEGERPTRKQATGRSPLFTLTLAPLPLMLARNRRTGDSVRVALFDPVSRGLREVSLRIEGDSIFNVSDSVRYDEARNRYVPARQIAVRGWRITGNAAPLTVWVDASGRLLAGSEPGGISLIRTTIELAFRNLPADHAAPARPLPEAAPVVPDSS